ncbi:PIF1-like helicase-domain-containing protein [Mycena haematopus]|nr:PIF1-like helicase-domain-containing protein [Mycena haematopus]
MKENVSRYPGAVHKSFASLEQAETWLAFSLSLQAAQSPSRSVAFPHSQKPYSRTGKLKAPTPPLEVVNANRSDAEASPSKIILSDEQQAVLQRIKRRESIFFSGSAGTGKSVLLREIIKELKDRDTGSNHTLGITASTGIAAINIGGCTLHSWAGIGIGNESAKKMVGKFFGQAKNGSSKLLDRWKMVKTLIIDEISMVDGQLFDKRRWHAFFVETTPLLAAYSSFCLVIFSSCPQYRIGLGAKSLLPSLLLMPKHGRLVLAVRSLSHGFSVRKTKLLNAMRFGKIENVQAFTALAREVKYTDGIQPTEL